MKQIIHPIEKEILIRELTDEKFIRYTNNINNEIYIVSAKDSPHVMLEIGRLRELTFRAATGGTGKDADIDEADTGDIQFRQLIVWNPAEQEIVGGYRFILGSDLMPDEQGVIHSPTSHLFRFSEKFKKDYWPYCIELGRSFVQPAYQPSVNSRKGLFSLDNIWDGLGAIIVAYPQMKYFFGKMTMYPYYRVLPRDMILYFLRKHFPDNERLLEPLPELRIDIETGEDMLRAIFTGSNYEEDYRILNQQLRNRNLNIPPLVNTYMNLSSTMKSFGTALNHEFGEVEETAILVTIEDIFESKKRRHTMNIKRRG